MFSWWTTSPVARNSESTEPESHQMAKMFFFLVLFLLLVQKLHDSFTTVFTQNSSILQQAVHQPIAFPQLRSLKRHFWTGYWRTIHFVAKWFVRTCTSEENGVVNEAIVIMQDGWIGNTVGVQGVFEESLVWSMVLQQYCIHLLRRACKDRLAALW